MAPADRSQVPRGATAILQGSAVWSGCSCRFSSYKWQIGNSKKKQKKLDIQDVLTYVSFIKLSWFWRSLCSRLWLRWCLILAVQTFGSQPLGPDHIGMPRWHCHFGWKWFWSEHIQKCFALDEKHIQIIQLSRLFCKTPERTSPELSGCELHPLQSRDAEAAWRTSARFEKVLTGAYPGR